MIKKIEIARISGIPIKLDLSWFIILAFITWTLASGYFPSQYPELDKFTYLVMGLLSALLLFVSVLLHELSHSLVARRYNIPIRGITLFIFGGIAEMDQEPPTARSEILMAAAGPLCSGILALLFLIVSNFFTNLLPYAPIIGVLKYCVFVNTAIMVFNLVPGFPLDGGRAFRAILYAYYKDLRKATKIASTVGKIFAAFLIIIGVVGIFSNQGGGLWFILIGGFLYFIAGVSYQQVLVRQVLSKIKVSKLMNKKFKTLSPKMKLDTFMKSNPEKESYIVQGKGFKGILDLQALETLPSTLQQVVKLEQISRPLSQIKTLSKNETAYQAFRKIALQKLSAIPVVEKGKVVGIVTAKSIQNQLVLGMAFGKNIKR